ncbi:MAG: hypothetical protein HGA59_06560 [Chlorobiaceae bacterium]|jgi:hypothetical protein|nr:hypothetical protein [Chlorobiaceae bacterium]NTV15829.1 hypothetical protein [Chlorobiaceae bacterium]
MKTIRFERDGKFVGEIPDTGDFLKNIEAFEKYEKDFGIYTESHPAQAINLQAFTFGKIAINLFDDYLCAPVTNGDDAIQYCNYAIPFIVNGAFSIELYLKTLHLIFSNPQKGHKLLILFNNLPEALQITIKQSANEFMIKHKLSPEPDLLAIFEVINSAFEDWRYLHEEGKEKKTRSFPVNEIIVLLETLSRVCEIELKRIG